MRSPQQSCVSGTTTRPGLADKPTHVARERLLATVSTHALIIDHRQPGQERLLMARLAYQDHRWRKWSFPGGFVDQGECLETALCREVIEETGVQLLSWEQVMVVPFFNLERPHISFVFRCDHWEGEPSSRSRELLETEWVDRTNFAEILRQDQMAYPQMRTQVECLDWHFPEIA